MPDNILTTPAITIAGGLVVFGATQLAQRFALDPVTDLMKGLGRAAYVEIYYQNASSGVSDDFKREASRERRKCAAELKASLRAVRFHAFFCLLGQIPSKKDIERTVSLLIGLSNESSADPISARTEAGELEKLLGI